MATDRNRVPLGSPGAVTRQRVDAIDDDVQALKGQDGLQGATGPMGPAGPAGPGYGASIRGKWTAGTTYAVGDVVYLDFNLEQIFTGSTTQRGYVQDDNGSMRQYFHLVSGDGSDEPQISYSHYYVGAQWAPAGNDTAVQFSELALALNIFAGPSTGFPVGGGNGQLYFDRYIDYDGASRKYVLRYPGGTFGAVFTAENSQDWLIVALNRIVELEGQVQNQIPGVPTDVTASVDSQGRVGVMWQVPTGGVDGYRVYEDGILQRQEFQNSSRFITSDPNESHAYTVSAYNSAGESAQSQPAYTNAATPAAPGQPTVTNLQNDGRVNVNWPTVPNATRYRVYRNGTLWRQFTAPTGGQSSMSFLDQVPSAGTYTYRVSAVSNGGESSQSPPASVTVNQGDL